MNLQELAREWRVQIEENEALGNLDHVAARLGGRITAYDPYLCTYIVEALWVIEQRPAGEEDQPYRFECDTRLERLQRWLGSHSARLAYVDATLGAGGTWQDYAQLLADAQQRERNVVLGATVAALRETLCVAI